MKKKHVLILLLSILFASVTYAQSQKRLDKAYKIFDAGEYNNAIELLKDAYDHPATPESDKQDIIFKIAECYRITSQPIKAELWYSKAIKKGYSNPIIYLYYAQAMQMNEKFEDAMLQYDKYLELVPGDERATNGKRACEMIKEWLDNPTGYIIEEAHFFNSKENDYCPVFARDDYNVVFFTTSREDATGSDIHGATGQKFSDIYESRKDKMGKWSVPVPLGENINTEFEEGSPTLNGQFNNLYFCRCEKNKNKKKGCEVLMSTLQGEEWGKAELVHIGSDSIVVAHPSLSDDGNQMYFVSNMKGSIGAYDIWMVKKENGAWSQPINMGDKINTKGNEMFPYIHPDGTLYFSSEGHVGMGGLDIFKAEFVGNTQWKVQNMGYPVNSSMDDFGISFEKDVERGFFTSNRNSGGDDDIFSFWLPPVRFNLAGRIIDDKKEKPIAEAEVKLIGSDGSQLQSTTDETGSFKFMLKPATDYIIIASASRYLKGKSKETTKGLDQSKDFDVTIRLASIETPIELPNIFYDFGKATLRPESKASLDKLVETLNDNPNVTIELMAHTDARGSDESNQKLSQERAQSCVDYLLSKGIVQERLVPKGYGEAQPKMIDEKIHSQVPFFEVGIIMTEDFIMSLPSEDYQEIAHQINRRTEFRVLSTNYQP